MKPSEIIREVRNILFERGWNRGQYAGPDGSVCLVGALGCVVCDDPHFIGLSRKTELYEPGHAAYLILAELTDGIPSRFNDDAPSFDAIVELTVRAEKIAEQRESASTDSQ